MSSVINRHPVWKFWIEAALVVAVVAIAARVCSGQMTSGSRRITIEVFTNSADPEQQESVTKIRTFLDSRKGVSVRISDLADDEDRQIAQRLKTIGDHYKADVSKLPVIYGCNQVVAADGRRVSIEGRLSELLRIEVFVRTGCPRCANAKAFLKKIQPDYPGFEIRLRDIAVDAQARQDLADLVNRYRRAATSVPVFHFCNQLTIGFDSDATSGERILSILRYWTVPAAGSQRPMSALFPQMSPVPQMSPALKMPPVLKMPPALKMSPVLRVSPNRVIVASSSLQAGHLLLPLLAGIADGGGSGTLAEETAAEPPAPPLPPLPPQPPLPPEGEAAAGGESAGSPPPPDPATSGEPIRLPWFGSVAVEDWGLPLFTVMVGLVDGFNPCAMWVLLFLLSILVNLQSRMRILAVAGTFVFVSGAAYFAFMAAWLNVFLLVGLLRPIQIVLALTAIAVGSIHIKDFFAFKKGVSLSIPESAKPGIYQRVRRIVNAENIGAAISGAIVLAVLVNIVELLCTAGLPALYTEVLTMHQLPAWKNYLYLLLYNVAYMFDDALMVTLVVITLGKRKMQERHGRWLKLVSGSVILLLGLVMLFKPEWLV